MPDSALQMLRANLDDDHLSLFSTRLTEWLLRDLADGADQDFDMSESRARALLRATRAIDGPTLKQFSQRMAPASESLDTMTRIALYDLLGEADLSENEEIVALAVACAAVDQVEPPGEVRWCLLALAAFAWRDGFPIHHLDPASPPGEFSPAGQVVKRAAHLLRRQMERSATERDKLGRRLAYAPDVDEAGSFSLEDLRPEEPSPPLPPHYRPPIPVNYPEMANETLEVDVDEEQAPPPAAPRAEPISITTDDLAPEEPVRRMPAIKITTENTRIRQTADSPEVTRLPNPAPLASFTSAVHRRFNRGREPFTTTRLSVIVQNHPDGPGLHGVQVHVSCRGVRSHVAGTTNRDGKFLCELPVRIRSGLTYDVDVTWPRDLGGEVEQKSITLNGDRTDFKLPFYHRMTKPES